MPCYNTATYKRLQRILYCLCKLYHPRHKTACRTLQVLFLRLYLFNYHRYQTDTSGYNAACTTLERLPAPGRPAPIPDTSRHAGTPCKSAQPPIIIRYIREYRPCQPGGVSSYRARIAGKCYTRRGSPATGARRAARNHWRLPPHLFSGFRPIANKGEQ